MAQPEIRFDDGAAYERGMASWSRAAGHLFLDWLAPGPGLRWLDVGCGNGAFTELLAQLCAPAELHGIDPSEAQLDFARKRVGTQGASFRQGNAMALPFPEDHFDAAVMALVIFFVPDPAKGLAEMARVVRPGGLVASYAWDILGGGFPFRPVAAALRASGRTPPMPPSVAAASLDALRDLWTGAGLEQVETHEISVERSFADFEEFWAMCTASSGTRAALAAMAPEEAALLKDSVRAQVPADATGRTSYTARANAVRGRVPR